MYWACAGEAVYHKHYTFAFSPNTEFGARFMVAKMYRRAGGKLTSKWLSDTFWNKNTKHLPGTDTGWYGGFGGEKWATCADVLVMYENGEVQGQPFTAKNFCDRVFALQHNGGTILSKMSWGCDLSQLSIVLEAHHYGNYTMLNKYASSHVQALWTACKDGKQPSKLFGVKDPWTLHYPQFTRPGVLPSGYCCEECNPGGLKPGQPSKSFVIPAWKRVP